MKQKNTTPPDMILRNLQTRLVGSQFRYSGNGIPLVHFQNHRISWFNRQAVFRIFHGHRDDAENFQVFSFETEDGVAGFFASLPAKDTIHKLLCPYCRSEAVIRPSSYVYGAGRNYGDMYVCSGFPECDTYVGVEDGTTNPKGSLANAALRALRKKAHEAFDPLWRDQSKFTRVLAYRAAANLLNVEKFHIGWTDADGCQKLIDNIRAIKRAMENDDIHPIHHCVATSATHHAGR